MLLNRYFGDVGQEFWPLVLGSAGFGVVLVGYWSHRPVISVIGGIIIVIGYLSAGIIIRRQKKIPKYLLSLRFGIFGVLMGFVGLFPVLVGYAFYHYLHFKVVGRLLGLIGFLIFSTGFFISSCNFLYGSYERLRGALKFLMEFIKDDKSR